MAQANLLIIQGVESNYETDLFQPIIAAVESASGRRYGVSPSDDISIRVIADYYEIDEVCCTALVVQDNLRPAALPAGAGVYAGTDEVVRALGGTVLTGDQFYDYITAQAAPLLASLPIAFRFDELLDAGDEKSRSALRVVA